MPVRVEIYGAAGVAIGSIARSGRMREILESGLDLLVEQAAWHPLDGSPAQPSAALNVAEDDIFLAVAEEFDDGPVHAQWHDITLDVGAYRVTGQMPTMPGFDPGRALARPTGEFVLLRDVRIALVDDVDGPAVERPAAFVNRYVVDRVSADMMLGFFFPGAEMVVIDGHERVATPPITAGPPTAGDEAMAADAAMSTEAAMSTDTPAVVPA
jgi:hypothetical protein